MEPGGGLWLNVTAAVLHYLQHRVNLPHLQMNMGVGVVLHSVQYVLICGKLGFSSISL